MTSFLDRIKEWIQNIVDSVIEFVADLFVDVLVFLLGIVQKVLNLVPVPDFLSTPLDTHLPDEIIWFLIQSSFPECLGIILSGMVFKILKQLLTMGIWK